MENKQLMKFDATVCYSKVATRGMFYQTIDLIEIATNIEKLWISVDDNSFSNDVFL